MWSSSPSRTWSWRCFQRAPTCQPADPPGERQRRCSREADIQGTLSSAHFGPGPGLSAGLWTLESPRGSGSRHRNGESRCAAVTRGPGQQPSAGPGGGGSSSPPWTRGRRGCWLEQTQHMHPFRAHRQHPPRVKALKCSWSACCVSGLTLGAGEASVTKETKCLPSGLMF